MRNKVKLAWIVNDAARRSTFNKRRKGLLKKAEELSLLCGVSTCAVIYSPYEPDPRTWPDHEATNNIISNFQNVPEIQTSKRMKNQEGYLKDLIGKTEEQLRKLELERVELELSGLLTEITRGRPIADLDRNVSTKLMHFLENKKLYAQDKIQRDRLPPN